MNNPQACCRNELKVMLISQAVRDKVGPGPRRKPGCCDGWADADSVISSVNEGLHRLAALVPAAVATLAATAAALAAALIAEEARLLLHRLQSTHEADRAAAVARKNAKAKVKVQTAAQVGVSVEMSV